ncbi:MAG: thioesterase family protein [Bacteroidia bacterium]
MYSSETQVRVRYADTDCMTYVYYGNYAYFYEVGRVEALRSLGLNYKEMEQKGIMLPVFSFSIKYFKPAFFDDLLTIRTMVKKMPQARIVFEYEMYNEKKELLNKGETTLVFMERSTNKPCAAPNWVLEKLQPFL